MAAKSAGIKVPTLLAAGNISGPVRQFTNQPLFARCCKLAQVAAVGGAAALIFGKKCLVGGFCKLF